MNIQTRKEEEDADSMARYMIDEAFKFQTNPRKFKGHIPILKTLGVSNFDSVASMDKLAFKTRDAIKKFQRLYKTIDKAKIEKIIQVCMARELQSCESRKDACEYALKRPKSWDSFDAANNNDLSAVKSATMGTPSRTGGSPSPLRKSARPDGIMRATGRDLNTTGFELKSLDTDGRGTQPVRFKEPPMLKGISASKSQGKDAAPTAAKLARLDKKSSAGGGGAKSIDDGAKSARSGGRSVISMSRFSNRS